MRLATIRTQFGPRATIYHDGRYIDLHGTDAALPSDPDCVAGRSGHSIYQVTLAGQNPARRGHPCCPPVARLAL